jgi:hypothetical protein
MISSLSSGSGAIPPPYDAGRTIPGRSPTRPRADAAQNPQVTPAAVPDPGTRASLQGSGPSAVTPGLPPVSTAGADRANHGLVAAQHVGTNSQPGAARAEALGATYRSQPRDPPGLRLTA